jgi:hypothetical protein
MTNRYVFLDDFRMPRDAYDYTLQPIYISVDWTIVRSYDEFIKDTLENGVAEGYSFDHDLADEHYMQRLEYDQYTEKTGYHCAKWLIYYCIDNKKELPATILIHSMNFAGSQNIQSLFDSYYKSLTLPSA